MLYFQKEKPHDTPFIHHNICVIISGKLGKSQYRTIIALEHEFFAGFGYAILHS